MLKRIANVLRMIRFSHTVFALPFAFMGALLAARGLPQWETLGLILLAAVGARTCAMCFNRIVDRRFDAQNPRTAGREVPAGQVTLFEAWSWVVASGAMFFLACYGLNRLTLLLSPWVLALTLFYSLTKRFTWASHIVLGLALALSPLGGFVAVAGTLSGYPYALSLGVVVWVAGFDMVYACLDADYDREAGLHSIPARFGRANALRLARLFHLLAFVGFALTGVTADLGPVYAAGLAVTAAALLYQHWIVRPSDLARIRTSFFTMNGLVSVCLCLSTLLSLVLLPR